MGNISFVDPNFIRGHPRRQFCFISMVEAKLKPFWGCIQATCTLEIKDENLIVSTRSRWSIAPISSSAFNGLNRFMWNGRLCETSSKWCPEISTEVSTQWTYQSLRLSESKRKLSVISGGWEAGKYSSFQLLTSDEPPSDNFFKFKDLRILWLHSSG